ncbi:hypothetical protein [Baaleninema sp.]|uniref:hypothetical protein n=1 Tax=Baaleninema sp. TaxID=3101197 RepID=UPI003D01521D
MEHLLFAAIKSRNLAVWIGRFWLICTLFFGSANSAIAGLRLANLSSFKISLPLPELSEKPSPCTPEPTGLGFPGFQPGTPRSQIEEMVGAPAQVQPGYWENTTALVYNLIPEKVSLGFLFDNTSDRLRQTEAAFARSMDRNLVLSTLDSMLGCQLNASIRDGFDRVWTGQTSAFSFSLPSIEGTIAWENETRVYIGIWQDDLH